MDLEALAEQGASLDQLHDLIPGAGYHIGVLDKSGNHRTVQEDEVFRMTVENAGYIDVLCLPESVTTDST